MHVHLSSSPALAPGVPRPLVTLDRWVYSVGVVAGLVPGWPAVVTVLLVLKLGALLPGERWNLISAVGRRLYADRLGTAEREDGRVIRFNRLFVAVLLAGAQVAFWLDASLAGWGLALAVAAANGVALAGFCVGCFLFFRLRLYRFRLLGR